MNADGRWRLPHGPPRITPQSSNRPMELTSGTNQDSRADSRRPRHAHPLRAAFDGRDSARLHRGPGSHAPDWPPSFRGRIVFAGVTAQTAVRDRWMTPYSNGIIMPGIEIHANAYETIARGLFLVDAPLWAVAAVTLAPCGARCVRIWVRRRIRANMVAACGDPCVAVASRLGVLAIDRLALAAGNAFRAVRDFARRHLAAPDRSPATRRRRGKRQTVIRTRCISPFTNCARRSPRFRDRAN